MQRRGRLSIARDILLERTDLLRRVGAEWFLCADAFIAPALFAGLSDMDELMVALDELTRHCTEPAKTWSTR